MIYYKNFRIDEETYARIVKDLNEQAEKKKEKKQMQKRAKNIFFEKMKNGKGEKMPKNKVK